MLRATLTIDPAFTVAPVDPRVYGSFVEHMGRSVYTGIYEPGHPTADDRGFRQDVAALVRELGTPMLRYPGGNFVSNYEWEDGIGPRAERPVRMDLAWRSIESNQVGTDDFVAWCRDVGSEPMMAVNLGTRGVEAARNLVEYSNHAGGTYWSDLRRKNGAQEPHAIKVWCLGNEMDGPWQIGHKTAQEYGRLAVETAKAMRRVDPNIELVACGSSGLAMSTFGSWERTVLTESYGLVDYVSLHAYYEEKPGGDRARTKADFLASSVDMDRFIESVVATADHVRAVGRHKKHINLSFDEWNVWYQSSFVGEDNLEFTEEPRLIEDTYSAIDAVVVGNLLISLLKHADRVKLACLAQLVNVIAPIRSEPGGAAWRQSIFHPFALTSRYGRGTVLRVQADAPKHDTGMYGDVDAIDATAVWDEETGDVVVFAVNRDQTQPVVVEVDLRGFPGLGVTEHVAVHEDDVDVVNSDAEPERVQPRRLEGATVDDGRLTVQLPPVSWNMLRLGTTRA